MTNIYYKKGNEWSNLILDTVYPIGSIYTSIDSTSPATLFGGTWARISGQFLLGATDNGTSGASQAAGNTGGAATVKLTAAQSGVPAHQHNYNKVTSPTGGTSITIAQLPKNYASFVVRKVRTAAGAAYAGAFSDGNSSVANSSTNDYAPVQFWSENSQATYGSKVTLTGSGSAHTHTIGTEVVASANNTTSAASSAHENMPPYISVYIWKRTA